MTRGYPDYSVSVGTSAEGAFLRQLAEPPVWYFDGFENPILKWKLDTSTGGVVTEPAAPLNSCLPYSGMGCLQMNIAATAEGCGYLYMGISPLTGKVAVSHNFALSADATFKDATRAVTLIEIRYYLPNSQMIIYIYYNPTTHELALLDSSNTYITIGTLNIKPLAWHYFKLIFDPANHKYHTLIIDATTFNISNYEIWMTSYNAASSLFVRICAIASDTSSASLLIDNFIITYNES